MTTPECLSLTDYIGLHEERVWEHQAIFGLNDADLERLMVDFDMGIEENLIKVAEGSTSEFVFCDHPTKEDTRLSQLRQSLAEEDFPIVVDYATLHHLFEVTLYAYVAYGLGVESPTGHEEVSQFKEEHLKESAEFPISVEIEGEDRQVILTYQVNPISEPPFLFRNQTIYERRWHVKSPSTRCEAEKHTEIEQAT